MSHRVGNEPRANANTPMTSVPRSILFVSPDIDVRDVYGEGLRKAGILPVFVESVAHALAFYRQVRVPVAVFHLDPDTPAAWSECERLCAQAVPVVILTARVRAEARIDGNVIAQSAAFIAAPCEPAEVAAIIQRVEEGERHIVRDQKGKGLRAVPCIG